MVELFDVSKEGKNTSVQELHFQDEIHDMADFIESKPELLGEGIRILCRELQIATTDEKRRIDFLAIDEGVKQVLMVELKKDIADETILVQVLRYANWVKNNPDAIKYQIKKKGLQIDEEQIDYDNVKVVIIAPQIKKSLVELGQYISAFEFDFIELKRFKSGEDKVYAVTDHKFSEGPSVSPSRERGSYSLDWYKDQGLTRENFDLLSKIIAKLETICTNNNWELDTKYVLWSIRFQAGSGRNVFMIDPRKREAHMLRINLGKDFDEVYKETPFPPSTNEILGKIEHQNKNDPWWQVRIENENIEVYEPLLKYAYENIIGV